jgi:hypothetical protein
MQAESLDICEESQELEQAQQTLNLQVLLLGTKVEPQAGSIIPSGQGAGGSTNVSFNIQAIDASGVEDVLIAQKGQIIRMIREAANEHGEFFLENVREEAYQQ